MSKKGSGIIGYVNTALQIARVAEQGVRLAKRIDQLTKPVETAKPLAPISRRTGMTRTAIRMPKKPKKPKKLKKKTKGKK